MRVWAVGPLGRRTDRLGNQTNKVMSKMGSLNQEPSKQNNVTGMLTQASVSKVK